MRVVALSVALAIVGLHNVAAFAQPKDPVVNTSSQTRPNPAQIIPTEQSRAQALKLAQMLNSEEITRQQIDRLYTVTMPEVIKQNTEYQELEKIYPGISDVAVQAERKIVEPASMARLPRMQQAIANIYAQYLSAADMDAISAFYTTPTGAKALKAAAEGTNFSQIIEKNMSGVESNLGASDIKTMVEGHATKFRSVLDDSDRRKLVSFGLSPAGRKWGGIQSLVLEATANQANQDNDKVVAQATENVIKAMTDFVNKADTARSAETATDR